MRHPNRASFAREAGFAERIADLTAASAAATARTWPGKPVIAAGHSFGALTALCPGGGMANLGHLRDPRVKAVLGFSSPGRVPGLIGPDACAGDALPMMIVTGDRDLVPGLVTHSHDHLLPIAGAPAGDKFAVVCRGAGHGMIGHPEEANNAPAIAASIAFLKACGLRDRAALATLGRDKDADGAEWIRR